MNIPFFDEVAQAKSVLIAGAGGGFDIVSGIPLYFYLRRLGKKVVLANLSFTELSSSESREVYSGVYHVTEKSSDLHYFPEKYLLNWLRSKEEYPDIYAFSYDSGVLPLSRAYRYIAVQHNIDTIILVDGGTDSLMFGDETDVGTIVEDACSILAASKVPVERNFLTAIGFGVERNLTHHACLENISALIKNGDYLGALSLSKTMPEGKHYLELVEYLNDVMPLDHSIVTNSVASALLGEFGDFHPTRRTKGSIQFISPLMSILWFFQTKGISSQIRFSELIENTTTMYDAAEEVQRYRSENRSREYKKIPLK